MGVAVILLGQGIPAAPSGIRAYFFQHYSRHVLASYPAILRWPLAWAMARLKAKRHTGSDIVTGGQTLAAASAAARGLQPVLGQGYSCFVALRFAKPDIADCVKAVSAVQPERIILLAADKPAMADGFGCLVAAWRVAARRAGLRVPTVTLAGPTVTMMHAKELIKKTSLLASPTF